MLVKFLFVLSLISCSDTQNKEASLDKASKDTQAVEKSPLPPTQKSLVALGGNITETIFALGEGKSVVAVDASSLYPKEVTSLPQVGYYRQVSTEGILSAKPSMVIASDAAGPKESIDQIKKIGVSVIQVPSEKTLDGTEKRIKQIASLLKKEKEGAKLIEQIHEDIKQIKNISSQQSLTITQGRVFF